MLRRRSNLGRRTRRAEAMRRVIANQTEEERASANDRKRQRRAQMRTNIQTNNKNHDWLSERAILAAKNKDVYDIIQSNFELLVELNSNAVTYKSVDTVVEADEAVNYPTEFSNSLHLPGLDMQAKIRHNRKEFQCEFCNKTFLWSSSLNNHRRTHTGEKPYKCNLCHKSFAQKYQLSYHAITHSGDKQHKCSLCSKTFSRRHHLECHMRTHTGEKPYQCKLCHKAFAWKTNLDCHKRMHSGEKPYKCSICQRAFCQKGLLDYHTRTHTGEKPYKCSFCHKACSGKGNLEAHIKRIHTREKPCICNLCDKVFAYRGDLKKHIRTHTWEKPYKCELCEKAFTQIRGLKKHLRIHIRHSDNCPEATSLKTFGISSMGDKCFNGKDLSTAQSMHRYLPRQNMKPNPAGKQLCGDSFTSTADENELILKPFGCGICDEMHTTENDFIEHCWQHRYNSQKDTFTDLFEGHLSNCSCTEITIPY